MRPSPATPEALREAWPARPGGSRAAGLASARCVCLRQTQGRLTPSPLARISHQGHGLRGAVGPAGKKSRAERCGASGKRLDAPCRPDSTALRVAPRRPPATSRASTVGGATLFGPLLADRAPERDAGRDLGEESGLRVEKFDRRAPTVVFFMPALQPQRQPERGGSASVFCVALLLSLLARPRCPVPAALTHEPGNGERPACPRRRAFFLVPEQNIRATTTNFNPCGEFFQPPTPTLPRKRRRGNWRAVEIPFPRLREQAGRESIRR